MVKATALPQVSFIDCNNITDIIVLLSEMQQLDTPIITSNGENRAAELVIQDILFAVGVTIATVKRTDPNLDTQFDSNLYYITEGHGDLHLRSTIERLLTKAVHDHKGIFIPWEIAGQMINDPACASLRSRIKEHVNDSTSPESIDQQPLSFEEASSLNELVALVHRAKTIKTSTGETMPAQEVIGRLQGLINLSPRQRQWPVIRHKEIVDRGLFLSEQGQIISPRLLSSNPAQSVNHVNLQFLACQHGRLFWLVQLHLQLVVQWLQPQPALSLRTNI